MTPPVFFAAVADAAVGDIVSVTGDEGRHAADVRRLRVGEAIDLTDGAGVAARCVVTAVRRGELDVEITERMTVPRPQPTLTVVQAMARGGRDEQAVESMTEVGVDTIVGWAAERCVAKWTARTPSKWESVAGAAARQSRRTWWPQISGPASTADVAMRCAAADLALVLHEGASTPLSTVPVPETGAVVIVVGPEGGITGAELAALTAANAQAVRLGRTVLRSSTAGVAALSVVNAMTRWQ